MGRAPGPAVRQPGRSVGPGTARHPGASAAGAPARPVRRHPRRHGVDDGARAHRGGAALARAGPGVRGGPGLRAAARQRLVQAGVRRGAQEVPERVPPPARTGRRGVPGRQERAVRGARPLLRAFHPRGRPHAGVDPPARDGLSAHRLRARQCHLCPALAALRAGARGRRAGHPAGDGPLGRARKADADAPGLRYPVRGASHRPRGRRRTCRGAGRAGRLCRGAAPRRGALDRAGRGLAPQGHGRTRVPRRSGAVRLLLRLHQRWPGPGRGRKARRGGRLPRGA